MLRSTELSLQNSSQSAVWSYDRKSDNKAALVPKKKRRRILQASAAAVCLTGPYLRLSGRAGVGQHQHVEHQSSICMVHLVTQDTAVTRQTLAAKSHPFENNTLHLLPFEHLRNLVATHPAAVGFQWSNHVWDPFFVGLPCQQTGFTFGKQPVLAERYVHQFARCGLST